MKPSASGAQVESPGLHPSLSSELSADAVYTLNKVTTAVTKQSASFQEQYLNVEATGTKAGPNFEKKYMYYSVVLTLFTFTHLCFLLFHAQLQK